MDQERWEEGQRTAGVIVWLAAGVVLLVGLGVWYLSS